MGTAIKPRDIFGTSPQTAPEAPERRQRPRMEDFHAQTAKQAQRGRQAVQGRSEATSASDPDRQRPGSAPRNDMFLLKLENQSHNKRLLYNVIL